jgi:hypothetical protein
MMYCSNEGHRSLGFIIPLLLLYAALGAGQIRVLEPEINLGDISFLDGMRAPESWSRKLEIAHITARLSMPTVIKDGLVVFMHFRNDCKRESKGTPDVL